MEGTFRVVHSLPSRESGGGRDVIITHNLPSLALARDIKAAVESAATIGEFRIEELRADGWREVEGEGRVGQSRIIRRQGGIRL